MASVLKFWHKWSWAFHLAVWLVMGTTMAVTYRDSIANNTSDIAAIKQENLAVRMAVQEQANKDIDTRLERMETVQGKIFERINQIADRRQ